MKYEADTIQEYMNSLWWAFYKDDYTAHATIAYELLTYFGLWKSMTNDELVSTLGACKSMIMIIISQSKTKAEYSRNRVVGMYLLKLLDTFGGTQ